MESESRQWMELLKFPAEILLLTMAIAFLTESALACTCAHQKLSKRFRKAEAVFVGTSVYVDESDSKLVKSVQNYRPDRWVLEAKKSWKGVRSKLIAVEHDYGDFSGSCPSLTGFELDEDYLVFAYGSKLKVTVECPDSVRIRKGDEYPQKQMKRLDRFWFRFWARVWPF